MIFLGTQRRCRIRATTRGAAALVAFVVFVVLWVLRSGVAGAAPLSSSRVGGLNLSSPTARMVTGIYWNPAALGLLKGTHVFLDGTLRMTMDKIKRRSIDPASGLPASGSGSESFPEEKHLFLTPDCFGGVVTDLGSSTVVIGVGVYTPFAEMDRFDGKSVPGAGASLRYHRVRSDWFNLFVSPVVAARLHRRFFIGVGLSYVRSVVKMSYYRDRTLREVYKPTASSYVVEDPSRGELVEVNATDNSFAFKGGILVNLPAHVRVGVTYRSMAMGIGRTNIEATGSAKVTRWDEGQGWHSIEGRAKLFYKIPDSVSVGVSWQPQTRWRLDLTMEWLHFSEQKDLHFKLSGNEFRSANMGNWDVNFRRYRGFQDVWRVQVAAAYKVLHNLTLGGAFLYESTAVPTEWVNAAAVDNHKADILVTVEWYPHKSVSLDFGYSLTVMPPVDVGSSGFDPSLATSCVANKVDIVWGDDCNAVSAGKGLPSASGRYWLMVHKVGFSVSYHYR